MKIGKMKAFSLEYIPLILLFLPKFVISMLTSFAISLFSLAFPPFIFDIVDWVSMLEPEDCDMFGVSAISPDEPAAEIPPLDHRIGSPPPAAYKQGKVSCLFRVAVEAVRKLLSLLIWELAKGTMLSFFMVASESVKEFSFLLARHGCQALLYTAQNIDMMLRIGIHCGYGHLIYSSLDLEATDQHRIYNSYWIDTVRSGIMCMPFLLELLAVCLSIRREESLMITGSAFYGAVVGILWFLCSPLPLQYFMCLVFSSSAIFVVGVVLLRTPGKSLGTVLWLQEGAVSLLVCFIVLWWAMGIPDPLVSAHSSAIS